MIAANQPKQLFFNDVQSRVLQIMPKTLICEWGRGTGKGVVEAGRILYAVQHMLGHKNVATTQIYADMADETKRQSVDRMTLKPRVKPALKVVNQ